MSIPNEALQKLVEEIETKAMMAQREISLVKTTVATKQRDARLMELTSAELSSLAPSTKVYEGVGKMFVSASREDVEERLASDRAELKSDISSLAKKLHYLETTHKNSRDHIEQILKNRHSG